MPLLKITFFYELFEPGLEVKPTRIFEQHQDGNTGGALIQRIPANLLGRYPEPDRIAKDSV